MENYDIILITAEPYIDHPFSGVAILKHLLEDKNFKVAIIDNPDYKNEEDFKKFGKPNLFFGITSGSIDSMLVNYTPLKKKRQENEFSKMSYEIPDRAITVYCNIIKKLFKGTKIVIGGTESSLRRFTHYDYWDNKLRKSILFDTRADILVYGFGELQTLEIAERIKENKNLTEIKGTAIISNELPEGFTLLPSHEDVSEDKKKFCDMQNQFTTKKNLAQKTGDKYILQYEMQKYREKDLDYFYSFNYNRNIPKNYPEMKSFQFSIITHRGCFGDCNFCSIAINSGKQVISRSEISILDEIEKITKHKDFNGTIELSGASANMYGMDCDMYEKCKTNSCMNCNNLDSSHNKIIQLLDKARKKKLVKKILVKSGVRYDLAMRSEEYLKNIIMYHNDGKLMIAPEHTDKNVLKMMNKEFNIEPFIKKFYSICKENNRNCDLSYYTMVAHPGSTSESSKILNNFLKTHKFSEFVQIFTPTPMSNSTCMYYTGMEPKSKESIYVPYTYNEKKQQKNTALGRKNSSDE